MTWEAITAIAAILGIPTTIGSVAFFAGRLTQQISDNRVRLAEQSLRIDKHDERLDEHEIELTKLKEWRNGYNAAASMAGMPKQVGP